MSANVITISREFGSGGRLIAAMVAHKMDYKLYDKELIRRVACEHGYDFDFIEKHGESGIQSPMLGLADTGMGRALPVGGSPLNLQDQLHVLQSQVIREAAEKGRCIIVGRAADYILRKRRDCLNVFILSDPEHRKQRAIELGAPPEDVEKVLRKKDKDHASHYRHYTEQVWGDPKNYHLSLHSGKLGYDLCCDLIIAAAELF